MAEVLRTEAASPDECQMTNTMPAGKPPSVPDLPELPQRASPASNPAWNRSAEAVGRSVGTAVAEVRRLPRRIDDLKSRIHVVGENAGTTVSHVRNSAEARTAALREAAEVGLLEFADKAAAYTEEVGMRASERMRSLRRRAWWTLENARCALRRQMWEAGQWKPQRPLHTIAVAASAAFAFGVLLRIWRSSHE